MERLHLFQIERGGRRQRVDARTPQGFVRVDVPDARNGPLIEDRGLHRSPTAGELRCEVACAIRLAEWLAAHARVDVRLDLVGLEQQPRAEPADVSVGDLRAVVERDESSPMQVGRRSVARQHRARHPEVDQQRTARLEPDDQVLAAAVDLRHALALELPRHVEAVERTGQPRVDDLDPVEPSALERRREPDADGLDLRQLGQLAHVTTSRSTERSAGAAGPNSYAASTSAAATAASASLRA